MEFMSGPEEQMRGPLTSMASLTQPTASQRQWLFIFYCSGFQDLALPGDASASHVAEILRSQGHIELAQLLAGPLPEGVGVLLALDMHLGTAPSLCVVRTDITQMREWTPALEYSVSLTHLLRSAAQWVPAAQNVLILLPRAPRTGSMAPLFPSTPQILAALPKPTNQPRLGTAPDDQSQTALLNTMEVKVALEEARREGGPRLNLLLSENCLQPSLETAFQLLEEMDCFAPLRCGGSGHVLESLTSLLGSEQALPAEPTRLLTLILDAASAATRSPQTTLPWQGLNMGRVSHLYFLCTQFAGNSQTLWQEDRAIQTAFLLSCFKAGTEGDDYRDLFAWAQALRFELHRLPFAALEKIDPVMLSQLTDNIIEVLKVQRNQPPLFLLPSTGDDRPRLPVYLPSESPLPEFQMMKFAEGGWFNLIHLMHAARS